MTSFISSSPHLILKYLNEDENASQVAYKVGEQPFCTFKSVIKYKIISSYNCSLLNISYISMLLMFCIY